jgi:hypothetical protein
MDRPTRCGDRHPPRPRRPGNRAFAAPTGLPSRVVRSCRRFPYGFAPCRPSARTSCPKSHARPSKGRPPAARARRQQSARHARMVQLLDVSPPLRHRSVATSSHPLSQCRTPRVPARAAPAGQPSRSFYTSRNDRASMPKRFNQRCTCLRAFPSSRATSLTLPRCRAREATSRSRSNSARSFSCARPKAVDLG